MSHLHASTSVRSSFLAATGVLLAISGLPAAQGKEGYCNFEYHPVQPVVVANVSTFPTTEIQTFLLVCNTPDSSVEVYRIDGSSGSTQRRDEPEFIARIPVGLEPVSVAYHRWTDIVDSQITQHQMMYTANSLGDSVTFVELFLNSSTFSFRVRTEVQVTDAREPQDESTSERDLRCDDEPTHIGVVDREETLGRFLLVTKAGASSYSAIDRYTGAPVDVACVSGGGANVILTGNSSDSDGAAEVPFGRHPLDVDGQDMALKEPRMVRLRPDADEYWILAHRSPSPDFDFDLWGVRATDFDCPPEAEPTYFSLGGLGTAHFGMAFDADGDSLYVIGTDAQFGTHGNGNLLAEPTGFVRSMLYQVDMGTLSILPLDLNANDPTDVGVDPVSASDSLAHPTGIALYRDTGAEEPKDYVCVTAFNSDRLGIVDTETWAIERIPVEDPTDSQATRDEVMAGPRGLAVWANGSASNHRIYVVNSIDSSISVISPNVAGSPTWIGKFPLNRTVGGASPVVPDYISEARKFLYSTAFSGSSFVSCASCHIDARLDQGKWRLTTHSDGDLPLLPTNIGASWADRFEVAFPEDPIYTDGDPLDFDETDPTDPELNLDETMAHDGPDPDPGANAKGPMMTQSLQGLVNFEAGGTLFDQPTDNRFDDLLTNAPYHWRGDKDGFRHFNEAFVNLQGMDEVDNSGDEPDGGLTGEEMSAFEQFVNSIHYPPNPIQQRTRTLSGEEWTDSDSLLPLGFGSSNSGATGGYLGALLFHILPGDIAHNLVFIGLDGEDALTGRSCVQCHVLPEGSNNRCTEVEADPSDQPVETAALRGIFRKEAKLELSGERGAPFELFTGASDTSDPTGLGHDGTRTNSRNGFVSSFVLGATDLRSTQIEGLVDFLREFDHGVAPMVGFTKTVVSTAANQSELSLLEAQAEAANCGIAVYGRVLSGSTFVQRGYWYRLTSSGFRYKEVGGSDLTRAQVLALLDDSDDSSAELFIFRATPLGMEGRVAALDGIPEDPDTPGTPTAEIVGTTPNTFYAPIRDPAGSIPEITANWIPTVFSGDFAWNGDADHLPHSLQFTGRMQADLSLPLQHDAPRRLQVTGANLVPGATRIRIGLFNGTGEPRITIEMPIYPTSKEDGSDDVWETAVEFDPASLYVLVAGGPGRLGVQQRLEAADPATIGGGGIVGVALAPSSPQRPEVSVSIDNGATWTTPVKQIIPFDPIL